MLKALSFVLVGLVAGLAIALWLRPGTQPRLGAAADTAGPPPAVDELAAARLAALEAALDAEILERAALEERVDELDRRLAALGERSAAAAPRPGALGDGGPRDGAAPEELRERFRADFAARREEAEQRFVERLVAEGFAPERAEWLLRRAEELRMEALQAEYDAQRGVRPAQPVGVPSLRAELGDADYERYLRAVGRPTAVAVGDVLANSPAERSGLKPGDEILSYGGKRVFDLRELNTLTLEGTPGESVAVEVRRDGQVMQLVLPRGPLGIVGGGFRGR
jgi:hypothetical protein